MNPVAPLSLAHERGMRVFPLRENAKTPAIRDWQARATSDVAKLREWQRQLPRSNWGISASGFVVIDIDAVSALEQLGISLAETFTVATPRGYHVYYLAPEFPVANTVSRLMDGVDVRSAGGYVVAPGSVINGVAYKILSHRNVAPLPTEIRGSLYQHQEFRHAAPIRCESRQPARVSSCQMSDSSQRRYLNSVLGSELPQLRQAKEGTRNRTLHYLSCRLGAAVARKGVCHEIADEFANRLVEEAVAKGLPIAEVEATVASGMRIE